MKLPKRIKDIQVSTISLICEKFGAHCDDCKKCVIPYALDDAIEAAYKEGFKMGGDNERLKQR